MLTDQHEKRSCWEQIWYLSQRNKNGEFLYRKGLTLAERNELLEVFYDFLDQERAKEIGTRYGVADCSEDVNPSPFADQFSWPDPEGSLWIPWAEDALSGTKRGRYAKGYPEGLLTHFTAGHRNGLEAGNELMRNTGMLYLLVDKDGRLSQSDSLCYHGYHGGKSSHPFADGYVSDEFHGCELQSAGMLTLDEGGIYRAWWGGAVRKDQVVTSGKLENIAAGHYHFYTAKQINTLRRLCVWLYMNNPSVFSIDRVVGHDEVSPGRKTDPGACIYLDGKIHTMNQFRRLLWNDVDRAYETLKN